ncbi:uncharacterized protein Z518_07960 [Rhinocladiella mackenziei CBS 650.93]|uniref:Uncharacterized protein n=1 Tax=Rhinocladiella mackenziei CBS 650.93 TaxID=1442369 RepID=A0A0D2IFJ5_9EURO|nr:uncharacterized protein Z518_07960 [Rhinocladiella mackenziei CBS 650.93]KIX02021.1 hypothetical protein Z518_07960 [Rhinocladiella mackenziei CBS 650.93]
MGASDKPKTRHRSIDHARFFPVSLDAIIPQGKVVFVIQDWGSGLEFDWAYQHRNYIAGLAFMGFIRPHLAFDDEVTGREMIIDQNLFIKAMMLRGLVQQLSREGHESLSATVPGSGVSRAHFPPAQWDSHRRIPGRHQRDSDMTGISRSRDTFSPGRSSALIGEEIAQRPKTIESGKIEA